VDELKRENQKLLQIIAQLQAASLNCLPSPLPPATTHTPTASALLGDTCDGEVGGPPGTCHTSTLSAGLPPDSIDSAGRSGGRSAEPTLAPGGLSGILPAGLSGILPAETSTAAAAAAGAAAATGEASQQHQQHKLLAPTASWPIANNTANNDPNASGSCVLSQPVNTSAVFSSSTLQLLSGSAAPQQQQQQPPQQPPRQQQPVPLLQQTASAPVQGHHMSRHQVLLQRTCGCTGDEECEECEGVRVTLSSASNLPLVTTPGPRPKLLTLEDLHLHGECDMCWRVAVCGMCKKMLRSARVLGLRAAAAEPWL
jgi:hypothetical protein